MIIDSDASKRPIIIRTKSNLVNDEARRTTGTTAKSETAVVIIILLRQQLFHKTPKVFQIPDYSSSRAASWEHWTSRPQEIVRKELKSHKRRHVHKYRGYRIQPFQFCLGKKASMVNIKVDEDNQQQFMVADMSWTEYLGAFTICCGVCQVKVPLSAVKSVRSVANLWDERRGIRVGSGIPWVFLLGSTWFCSGKIAIHPAIHPAILSFVTFVIHPRTRFCSNIWTKRSRSYC